MAIKLKNLDSVDEGRLIRISESLRHSVARLW